MAGPHAIPATDLEWLDDAACRGADPEAFFNEDPANVTEVVAAWCAGCPVTAECLEYAQHWKAGAGVFGGRTTTERRRMR